MSKPWYISFQVGAKAKRKLFTKVNTKQLRFFNPISSSKVYLFQYDFFYVGVLDLQKNRCGKSAVHYIYYA